MGGAIKAATSFVNTVKNAAAKLADISGKLLKVANAPQDFISGAIKKLAGPVLDKLPVIGPAVKPFVDKLIDSGVSFLLKGPLGVVGDMASKLAPHVGNLANFAETVSGVLGKVGAGLESTQNLQEIFSSSQAEGLLERYAA